MRKGGLGGHQGDARQDECRVFRCNHWSSPVVSHAALTVSHW
jgi:hypothetical protein